MVPVIVFFAGAAIVAAVMAVFYTKQATRGRSDEEEMTREELTEDKIVALRRASACMTAAAVMLIGAIACLVVYVSTDEEPAQDNSQPDIVATKSNTDDVAPEASEIVTEKDDKPNTAAPTKESTGNKPEGERVVKTSWYERWKHYQETMPTIAMTESGAISISALLGTHGYWYYGRDPVRPRAYESEDDVKDERWWVYTDGTNVIRLLDDTTDRICWIMCDHGDVWSMVLIPMYIHDDFNTTVTVEGQDYRINDDVLVVLMEFLEYDHDDTPEGDMMIEPSYYTDRLMGATPLGEAA